VRGFVEQRLRWSTRRRLVVARVRDVQPRHAQRERIVAGRGSRKTGRVRNLDTGVHADERVHIAVAHGQDEARHTAQVETQRAEPLGVDERQLPRLPDDELEIANLRLEILGVEFDEGDVRSDERGGCDDEAAAGEILGRG
jgi:hypothetical protein